MACQLGSLAEAALLATALGGAVFVNLVEVPLLFRAARTGQVRFSPAGRVFGAAAAVAALLGGFVARALHLG